MPIIVDEKTDKPVAFRCQKHRDVPPLNRNVPTEFPIECGACCLDQAADALLGQLGEMIEKAATRLEFFEPGTGDQLRHQYAEYINSIATETEAAKEPK